MDDTTMDHERRRLLRGVMSVAAAHFGTFGLAAAAEREPRELAAIGRATDWINSPRLTATSLRGKVVLVDFWTYTCINWLRTAPYLRTWAAKYGSRLVVIGVHTPEFPFEHDLDNVRRAVRARGIEYPVVVDNDYAIWRAFENQYWPALYFLDGDGRVRQRHFGEGEYERSERTVQRLLANVGAPDAGSGIVSVAGTGVEAPADWNNVRSPETYLGHERTERFASSGGLRADRRRAYAVPARLSLNHWALGGEWTATRLAAVLNGSSGLLSYRFHARDLHLVMGPSRRDTAVRFRVSLDGQAPGPAHGVDVDSAGNGTLTEQRMYQLIRQPMPIGDRHFTIEFLEPGVEAFAFTFG